MKRRARTYSNADNARRAIGDVVNWPPSDVDEETVVCPECGWSGEVYVTRGAPPAVIHCPSPGSDENCVARIRIPGGASNPIQLGATGGWFLLERRSL